MEALIAAYNPPYGNALERWGSTIANAFVAFGVFGELLAGIRVKVIQGELTRRSNDELSHVRILAMMADGDAVNASIDSTRALTDLADAKRELAKANERASSAEKAAAEARERTAEIERVTAWRRVSSEQRAKIVHALRNTGEDIVPIVQYQTGDPEAHTYAREILSCMIEAGAKGFKLTATFHSDVTFFGCALLLSPGLRTAETINSLQELGMFVLDTSQDPSQRGKIGERVATVYCWVGPKPQALPKQTATESTT